MEQRLSQKIEYLLNTGYKQTEIAHIIGCGQSMISMMKDGYEPKNKRLSSKIEFLYSHEKKRV